MRVVRPKAYWSDWCEQAAKTRAAEDEQRIAEATAQYTGVIA
jgi:hypothetical protein